MQASLLRRPSKRSTVAPQRHLALCSLAQQTSARCAMNKAQQALLEKRDGSDVGRDPRKVSREELIAAGHQPKSPLKALRLRCIDCCAGQPSEVRLCTAGRCANWPFRLGTNPWRKEPTDAQRERARSLMHGRRAGVENKGNERSENGMSEVAATPLPDAKLSSAKPSFCGIRRLAPPRRGGAAMKAATGGKAESRVWEARQ